MTSFRDQAQSLAATGLTGAAKLLRAGAAAMSGAASLLRPGAMDDERPERQPAGKTTSEAAWENLDRSEDAVGENESAEVSEAPEASQAPEASEPPEVPAPDVVRASVAPSHVAGLAEGTVAEITRAIDSLSTDELRMLLEHETTHRKRKGVLDAIERALTS